MSILIAHPSRQHSHQLAHALYKKDMLTGYYTLLPDKRILKSIPFFHFLIPSSIIRNHALSFLPDNKFHVLIGPLLFNKFFSKFNSTFCDEFGQLISYLFLDYWVAIKVKKLNIKGIVGYEMCCANTFKIAKSRGIICILDAAAFHYKYQNKILGKNNTEAHTLFGKILQERKEIEIKLADYIICPSLHSKQSYVDAGISPNKIFVNTLGCDTKLFNSKAKKLRKGPPKFIFIGSASSHKGFDMLINSFKELVKINSMAELHIIGDCKSYRKLLQNITQVKSYGKLSHLEISKILPLMDFLILPSQLDSFGMVVPEALSSGVQVIVSANVGASDLVIKGKNGWVINAPNVNSLFKQLYFCTENIRTIRSHNNISEKTIQKYDWINYRKRSVKLFSSFFSNSHLA